MAFLRTCVILIIAIVLIVQPWCSTGDIFSPIFDNLCEMMECGKGNCKLSQNSTLGFVCECNDGWKQASLPYLNDLQFLPCVVPDCTLNSACLKIEFSLPPDIEKPFTSAFNPCHWIDCGGGTCNQTSLFKYRCECEEGYYNLSNHTSFPCYKQCALGSNCARLGIITSSSQQISAATSRDEGYVEWLIFRVLLSVLKTIVLVI